MWLTVAEIAVTVFFGTATLLLKPAFAATMEIRETLTSLKGHMEAVDDRLAIAEERITERGRESRQQRDWLIEMNSALPPDKRVRINRT